MNRIPLIIGTALAVVLLLPAAARAAPPPNDNRASAQAIPTFPANIAGTTVEATVERLDPQVSKCSRIEGTVWYRIDQAPDGTVALSVQGAGLAPVLRVYSTTGALSELDCSAVAAGKTAQVAFETNRGATYLVLVGRRPSTKDAGFTLTAKLYLPPANDTTSEAQPLTKLPATDKGSTTGATSDDNDLSELPHGRRHGLVLPQARIRAAADREAPRGGQLRRHAGGGAARAVEGRGVRLQPYGQQR